MKIKLTTDARVLLKAGTECETPADYARKLIALGMAEEVKPEPKKAARKKAE